MSKCRCFCWLICYRLIYLQHIFKDFEEDYAEDDYYEGLDDDDTPTYDRYGGSYAQDVMGYSDDDIDTIFDGDPDAYWNID